MAHQESFLPLSPIGLCQFPGFSSPVTSQQASLNWLLVSDSAHSGGAAADAVVPVALYRPWVRLDSEALVRWSSEIEKNATTCTKMRIKTLQKFKSIYYPISVHKGGGENRPPLSLHHVLS